MTLPRLCCTLLLFSSLLTTRGLADNACAAFNLIEVSAALHGPGEIYSIHREMPEKKASFCVLKRAVGGPFADNAALHSAPGPELMFTISDPGAPSVVDLKIMDSGESVPSLGDRATIVTAPLNKTPGAPMTFIVLVISQSQSYVLIYEPAVADQQSREIAIQLAREVLLVRGGWLPSHPIAEQIISTDKAAAAQKPDSVELWNEIGALSYSITHFADARDAYLKITQLAPDDPGGYYGIALAAWWRSFRERTQRGAKLGLALTDETVLDPKYKDFCESFKKDLQAIIVEGFESAKKALQLRPDSSDYASYAYVLAKEKAATDCQDATALKADMTEAERLRQVATENKNAEASSGKKYVSKIFIGTLEPLPPPPPPPPSVAGAPGGTIGGVLGSVVSSAPADPSKVAQRVLVTSGVESGLLVTKVQPVYPPLARQARIQGTVTLQALISKDGDIENLQLISGHPMLVPAAIEAVRQWKYKSYLLNGEPVQVDTQIQVNFQLAPDPAGAALQPAPSAAH